MTPFGVFFVALEKLFVYKTNVFKNIAKFLRIKSLMDNISKWSDKP